MLTADFDVKIKLIILVSVALLVLLVITGLLLHRDHHFSRYLGGIVAVMVVLAAILVSLLLIHA